MSWLTIIVIAVLSVYVLWNLFWLVRMGVFPTRARISDYTYFLNMLSEAKKEFEKKNYRDALNFIDNLKSTAGSSQVKAPSGLKRLEKKIHVELAKKYDEEAKMHMRAKRSSKSKELSQLARQHADKAGVKLSDILKKILRR